MLGHSHQESQDRGHHRTRSARRPGVVRVPGDRLQSVHGVRRVRPRVPDGRHPYGAGRCRQEDRHLVVRRLHSVPSVRDRMSGAGRECLAQRRGGCLHSTATRAQRIVRYRSGHGTWHARASGSSPGPHPSRIGRSSARTDPRSTRALASCAPGGRRKLQRVRDGDCGDDEPHL